MSEPKEMNWSEWLQHIRELREHQDCIRQTGMSDHDIVQMTNRTDDSSGWANACDQDEGS